MIQNIRGIFSRSRSSICVLKPGKKVLFQNRDCRSLCGDFVGGACPQICASACGKDPSRSVTGEGVRFFPNTKIGNQRFDAVFVNNGSQRMVVLHPLFKKHELLLKRFEARGLSRREMEVVRLGLEGFSNSRICKEMNVSPATLKTHLNNIYRKFPEARQENWRGKA